MVREDMIVGKIDPGLDAWVSKSPDLEAVLLAMLIILGLLLPNSYNLFRK